MYEGYLGGRLNILMHCIESCKGNLLTSLCYVCTIVSTPSTRLYKKYICRLSLNFETTVDSRKLERKMEGPYMVSN